MDTTKKLLPLLLCGFFIASAPLYAETSGKETTGQYVDDTVITTKVKAAILKDTKLTEVKVETYKGVVQLSGFVKNQADIEQAGKIARGVTGVKSIKNDLQLKS
ncbi:BON domain-containing protein [Chitinimonas naiadis]